MMSAARRLSYCLEPRTERKYWVNLLVKSEQVVQSPAFLETHGKPGFAQFGHVLPTLCCAMLHSCIDKTN